MNVKIYTPQREENIVSLVREIVRNFQIGQELASRLFLRDLKAAYRKSFLGILWLFLPPLATAGIWIFLNSQRVVAVQKTPMDYAAFALCGTMQWTLFAEAITKPIVRFQNAMTMMSKLNFPREAVVLASLYDLMFSLVLKLIILFIGLMMFGYPPTWQFATATFFVFLLMLGGLSLGLLLSPLGLLYNDISKGLPIILPFAMYLTPVIYPLRKNGFLASLQSLNPVTPFLERSRSLLGGYEFSMQTSLWWWSIGLLMAFGLGLIILKISMPVIVERSGN